MTLTERIAEIEAGIKRQKYGIVLDKKLTRKESNERLRKLCSTNAYVTIGFDGNTMKTGMLSRTKSIFMVGERAFDLDSVKFFVTKLGKYEVV